MITGCQVTLGPILHSDFPWLFMWSDDLENARMNTPYRPACWRNQEEYWLNPGRDSSHVHFAIRGIGANEIIGVVSIEAIDDVNRSADLRIKIGSSANRVNGYGAEALQLAIDYCWNHLNLGRIAVRLFETNQWAINLYEKHGFEHEGRLRQAVYIDGRWLDMVLLGLLQPKSSLS